MSHIKAISYDNESIHFRPFLVLCYTTISLTNVIGLRVALSAIWSPVVRTPAAVVSQEDTLYIGQKGSSRLLHQVKFKSRDAGIWRKKEPVKTAGASNFTIRESHGPAAACPLATPQPVRERGAFRPLRRPI